jgi:hypothetical protein
MNLRSFAAECPKCASSDFRWLGSEGPTETEMVLVALIENEKKKFSTPKLLTILFFLMLSFPFIGVITVPLVLMFIVFMGPLARSEKQIARWREDITREQERVAALDNSWKCLRCQHVWIMQRPQ